MPELLPAGQARRDGGLMAYQRGKTAQPVVTVQSVEQARRRNAALRIELASLTVENMQLESRVGDLRGEVSKARKLLARKVRELKAAQAQVELLGTAPLAPSDSRESLYGGQAGLEAATAEMEAFESRGLKLSKQRERKGPSHGTGRCYQAGCRCTACLGWRRRKSDQDLANYHRRQAARKQVA